MLDNRRLGLERHFCHFIFLKHFDLGALLSPAKLYDI